VDLVRHVVVKLQKSFRPDLISSKSVDRLREYAESQANNPQVASLLELRNLAIDPRDEDWVFLLGNTLRITQMDRVPFRQTIHRLEKAWQGGDEATSPESQ